MISDMDKYIEEYKQWLMKTVEERTDVLKNIKSSIKELKIYSQNYQKIFDSILPIVNPKNYEAVLLLGQRLEDDLKGIKKTNHQLLTKLNKDYSLLFNIVPKEIVRDYFGKLENKINKKD
jgi:predicted nuclease with TOPRIM domain